MFTLTVRLLQMRCKRLIRCFQSSVTTRTRLALLAATDARLVTGFQDLAHAGQRSVLQVA
jgi:hypothetical protein